MEDKKRLATEIRHFSRLKEIRFDDYEVHASDIPKLAEYLKRHHNIVSIDVGSYPISDDESEILAIALLKGGNKNILYANIYNKSIFSLHGDEPSPTVESLNALCIFNSDVANNLINKMTNSSSKIDQSDRDEIEHRKLAISHLLKEENDRDDTEIAKLFSALTPAHTSRAKRESSKRDVSGRA